MDRTDGFLVLEATYNVTLEVDSCQKRLPLTLSQADICCCCSSLQGSHYVMMVSVQEVDVAGNMRGTERDCLSAL